MTYNSISLHYSTLKLKYFNSNATVSKKTFNTTTMSSVFQDLHKSIKENAIKHDGKNLNTGWLSVERRLVKLSLHTMSSRMCVVALCTSQKT